MLASCVCLLATQARFARSYAREGTLAARTCRTQGRTGSDCCCVGTTLSQVRPQNRYFLDDIHKALSRSVSSSGCSGHQSSPENEQRGNQHEDAKPDIGPAFAFPINLIQGRKSPDYCGKDHSCQPGSATGIRHQCQQKEGQGDQGNMDRQNRPGVAQKVESMCKDSGSIGQGNRYKPGEDGNEASEREPFKPRAR